MGKGGKPKIEVTKYYMSEHFGICMAEPDALLDIVVKEKSVDLTTLTGPDAVAIDKPELFGGEKKEGGLSGTMTYLPGDNAQVLPDALAQKLGRADGDDCPGYRGIASIFFTGKLGSSLNNTWVGTAWTAIALILTGQNFSSNNGFYWTSNTPFLPGVWAKVQRIFKRADGTSQWYSAKAGIFGGFRTQNETDIEFVGEQGGQSVSGNGTTQGFSLANGIDTAPSAGDLVIICANSTRPASDTDPYLPDIPGYTRFALGDEKTTVLRDHTMQGFYKFMPDPPDTDWTASGVVEADGNSAYHVTVWRGVDPSDPFLMDPAFEYLVGAGTKNPADIVVGVNTIDPGSLGTESGNFDISVMASFALRSADEQYFMPIILYGETDGDGGLGTGNLTSSYYYQLSSPPTGSAARSGVVFGLPIIRSDFYDMNPAHIIHECLTDTSWGMGTPTSSIDEASFIAAADTLYDEFFGLSMLWTRQAEIQDFVNEVLDHIQGVLYVDPSTGLITIDLIRGDYDPDLITDIIDPDNADLSNFSRKLWGDIVNEIIVTWTNPENEQEETVTAQDNGSIAVQGGIVSDSRNYYAVRSATKAQELAWRDLRSAGQPLASCEAEVDRSQFALRPASVVKVNWPEYGLNGVVMRVQSVDYGKPGDPAIKVSMIEDVYGLDIGAYDDPPQSAWVDPTSAPQDMDPVVIMTLPYFMAANSGTGEFIDSPEYPEVISGILATTDNSDTFEYELWDELTLTNGDLEYAAISTNNIVGYATIDPALAIEASTALVSFSNSIGSTIPRAGGFGIIGTDEETSEIVLFDVDNGDDTYTIQRGVLDTVPRAWAAGTPIWFVDEATIFEDPLIRSAAELVDYKLLSRTSRGQLDIDDATERSATLTERPWLPNRPANVIAYGEAFSSQADPIDATGNMANSITVTWANRNRLEEDSQVLAWTDANVTPESGQTTTIEVRDALGALLATHDGLTGTSFNVPDTSYSGEQVIELRIYSERTDADGDFVSLQYFSHWLILSPPTFDTTAITFDNDTLTMDAS